MARAKIERVELNRRAVQDLLKSEGVQADLRRRAERIAQQAGPGHAVEVQVGRNRARAMVWTDTMRARYYEATQRTLTRAVDAGRD